jgi:hypothetical protein
LLLLLAILLLWFLLAMMMMLAVVATSPPATVDGGVVVVETTGPGAVLLSTGLPGTVEVDGAVRVLGARAVVFRPLTVHTKAWSTPFRMQK